MQRNSSPTTPNYSRNEAPKLPRRKADKIRDALVILLIVLSLGLVVFSFYAPTYFTGKTQFQDYLLTGTIGDTIGGVMNPFIALAGVFITFLAFYMQFRANKLQVQLFTQAQNEQNYLLKEQLFFRLIDNLNQRIINFSFTEHLNENTVTHTSYRSMDALARDFSRRMNAASKLVGRGLFVEMPEAIPAKWVLSVCQASLIANIYDEKQALELRAKITALPTVGERTELIKKYFGDPRRTNSMLDAELTRLAAAFFYTCSFELRREAYRMVYTNAYRNLGNFLDGYTKNIAYLIDFIYKNGQHEFFLDYLTSN